MSGEVLAPTCPICMQDAATVGVLCESCSDELCGTILITPEQINAPTVGGPSAALIDQWGRPNLIGEEATIGRDSENPGLAILHGSVSRQHATVRFERDDWTLRDMGSMNGTIVNGRLVKSTVKLADRDQIRFGPFRFYFVVDATKLPASRTRPAPRTVQTRPYERARTLELEPDDLPTASLVFHQPTGGGGGVVEMDGKQVQLTLPQFELLSLLAERMLSDEHAAAETSGFIEASMLLKSLSLDSTEPGEDSIRQLVRRVRRALGKANIRVMIESKQRLGYRLAVIPRIKREP